MPSTPSESNNPATTEQPSLNTQQKPLHIAMVIDAYLPIRNGTVESTRRFAEALRARGHQVTIISSGDPAPDKRLVGTFYIPYATPMIIKPMQMEIARPTGKQLANYLKDIDLVHIQLPFYLGWRTARYTKKNGIPCVATHHVQAEWISNAGITWKKAVAFCYRLFLRTYNKASCLICPSKMGIDDLKRYGFNGNSMVISNGVTEQFIPAQSKEANLHPGKFVILSVGRLAVEKYHDVTIAAIAKSKYANRIQLIIAGAGPQKAKLQKLSAQLPNPVEFILVKPSELVHYYQHADLFVHSAHTEMEGMSCLEAIACGAVPLIADSPLSASAQFALDQHSTYPFHDIDALSQKIDTWIEHPERLARMRPRYAEHAQQYRFEKSLNKLENLYYQTIAHTTDKNT